jgi:hypothetical protein
MNHRPLNDEEEEKENERFRRAYSEKRQREIAEFAKKEGAWYYDPYSPVVWKRYVIGPVPLWRRVLWWFFPPSNAKMLRIMQRRNAKAMRDATRWTR